MEHNLSQLKKFKQVTLNDEERGIIRAHIARAMIEPPQLVTQSLFQRGVTHGLRIALSSMLFVVFVGGSVSAVANNALPGDPLYAFKINVNEEVKGLLLTTPEQKVVWQKNRIENRVSEIKTLAASKSLTKAKQATVQKALDAHVSELARELDTLSDEMPNTALTVTASLEQSLKESKQTIKDSGSTTPKQDEATDTTISTMSTLSAEPTTQTEEVLDSATLDALQAVDDTLAKVSAEEVKIITKEIDKISTEVNEVPQSQNSVDTTPSPLPTTPDGS